MKINGKTKMCIIIGDPVEHSLSPLMHNTAYAHIGIDDQYVFTAAQVKVEHVKEVIDAMRVMGIRGLTCTIPHKIAVMPFLDEIDPIAKKIGAVNTVVNDKGTLRGYNTDWYGTVKPLEKYGSLKGKKIALIGAGGAARAMAYGVAEHGAHLAIFNRTVERAEILARDIGENIKAELITTLSEVASDYDILINATSLGMGHQVDKTPLDQRFIQKHHIVFDAVYVPYETRFIRESLAQGATVIPGIEMLIHQGTAQFRIYTGHEAPEDVMRETLFKALGIVS